MWLLIAFIAVPMIEIALFVQIGGFIGLWPTLLIVVLTAITGTYLVRSQGRLALGSLRSSFSDMRDPTEPLVHGAMILFSGALLLTPGFFTDAVGFALLIPAVRKAVFQWIAARVQVQQFGTGATGPRHAQPVHPRDRAGGDIIDGEYSEVKPDDDNAPKDGSNKGNSGWTRH